MGGVQLAWVLICKLSEVVNVLVDNNVEVGGFIMRCDVARTECFRHDAGNKARQ